MSADSVVLATGAAIVQFPPPPMDLVFKAGRGQVCINMETGAVELKDCDLTEAAIAFWKAVGNNLPRR